MGGWNLLGGLMPPAVDTAGESERRHSRDSGAEEEFEILEQEEIKEHCHSEDSGNCSEAEEGQDTNRVLEFQLTQSLLSQVKAGENNRNANSGKQAQLDLERMDFVINGQAISKEYVFELYRQYDYLISSGNEDYRAFAKQIFTGMFKHAKAEIPNDNVLEELITNCNQAGYEFAVYGHIHPILDQYGLIPTISQKTVSLCCNSAGCMDVEYSDVIVVKNPDQLRQYEAFSKLEFTLRSQGDRAEYENGKVTLTIPEQLKHYKTGSKSLLDDINEHFEDEDNRITEILEKNMNEGPKSFAAEDLSITESSSNSSEKVVTDPGILGNVANVLVGVAEVTAVVATELFWPQDQVNIEPRHSEEEFTIIPENLTFDGLIDVINKAKNYGDYADLDEIVNSIEESDRFITDLNRGNLKDFCSQQLNLTDYMYDVLSNNNYDEANGHYNYSVKELSLLAIAANDVLVERYAETHKNILFTQNEELDRLLIGVGGQHYVKFLLEHLEKGLDTILPWNNICEKLERASFVGNQKCVEVILNRFKNTETESRISDISSKLFHHAIQQDFIDVAKIIINRKVVDINSIDNSGTAPLHLAVARNNLELISLLIKNGAKIDIQDERYGRTALHWAAYHDKFEIVKLLVNEGANWSVKDKEGKTALDLVGTKNLYLVSAENREKPSSKSEITKFLEDLDDKTPLHLNIQKDSESKSTDSQQLQRNVAERENIIDNRKASKEAPINRRGKMFKNKNTIEEKLSNAIDNINLANATNLLIQPDTNIDKSTLQKLLGQASDKMKSLQESKGKKDRQKNTLTQIITLFEKELEKTVTVLPVSDEADCSSTTKPPVMNSTDSQQPQENVVDKGENIINSEKASEEAIVNRRGKMPKNTKTIEEKLSDAINSINYVSVVDLLKELDDSAYESTLQKLLSQANDKVTSLEEDEQKKDLAPIIALLKNELKHIATALPAGDDVGATASSQQIPVVERKESSSSLSSEEDDFSKLESDDSARISSDSPSFDMIDETEVPQTAAAMPSMVTGEKPGNINDKEDDKLESDDSARISSDSPSFEVIDEAETSISTAPEMAKFEVAASTPKTPSMATEEAKSNNEQSNNLNDEKDNSAASNSVNQDTSAQSPVNDSQSGTRLFTPDSKDSLLSQPSSDDEDDLFAAPLVSRDENSTISPQSLSLGFENESLDTVISIDNNRKERASHQSTEHVEQMANENTQPKSVANKQASNSNKSYTKENSVKWPTVATWMFAITGMLAVTAATAAYFALGTSLLVAGVVAGIGAFCIVVAIAIHYYNKTPSGSLKEPDAKAVVHNVAVGAS